MPRDDPVTIATGLDTRGGLGQVELAREVAGGEATVRLELERRDDLRADLLRERAARAEAAPRRRVERARDLARDAQARAAPPRHRVRDRREQPHRVRMERPPEELRRGRGPEP